MSWTFEPRPVAPGAAVKPNWYSKTPPSIHWADATGAKTMCGKVITNNFGTSFEGGESCKLCLKAFARAAAKQIEGSGK